MPPNWSPQHITDKVKVKNQSTVQKYTLKYQYLTCHVSSEACLFGVWVGVCGCSLGRYGVTWPLFQHPGDPPTWCGGAMLVLAGILTYFRHRFCKSAPSFCPCGKPDHLSGEKPVSEASVMSLGKGETGLKFTSASTNPLRL